MSELVPTTDAAMKVATRVHLYSERKICLGVSALRDTVLLCFLGIFLSSARVKAESNQLSYDWFGLFRGSSEVCFTIDLTEELKTSAFGDTKRRAAILSWTTSGIWDNGVLYLADMSRGPLASVQPGGGVTSRKCSNTPKVKERS